MNMTAADAPRVADQEAQRHPEQADDGEVQSGTEPLPAAR